MHSTIRAAIVGTTIALAALVSTPSSALAAGAPASRIYSPTENTCLDVSTTDPAHYFLDTYGAPCTGSAAQAFRFRATAAAHTYEVLSASTGQCLTKYRQGIRQTSCSTSSTWLFQQVGSSGHSYRMLVPYTVGTTSPECVQVSARPNGYPGPLFDLTACSADPGQVLRLSAAL